MKGINLLPAVPMRKEPSDKSEMVNQLLYGERKTTIGERKRATKPLGRHLGALDGERKTTIGERKNSKTVVFHKVCQNFPCWESEKLGRARAFALLRFPTRTPAGRATS